MFRKVEPGTNIPQMEEGILEFWKENNIFEKTLEKTKDGQRFVFYEGPPTANATPHPGHVLTRVMKDLIPRHRTMCGYHVPRKGGWDTHGLPVELEIEKELGISGKPQIEEYGVEKFIEKCKESVWRYKREWERMTERVGFWVDLENAYVTYEDYYIESVWWALKQIWEKGLLYKGHKVVPYCPRCGTALSSHEVAQGYQEVEDPSVYVLFSLKDEDDTAFLVWTTTPWTLPSNVALAVNEGADYVKIRMAKTGSNLILAKELLGSAIPEDEEYEIIDEFKGKSLVGKEYQPLFRYTEPSKKAWYVVAEDFVTLSDGTGIVHMAPAFGEDDMNAALNHDLPVVQLVDEEGRFTEEVSDWKGMHVKEADPLIIEHLMNSGRLYRSEQYSHTYPFCWRCDTPLLYYARTSWFIKTTAVKDALLRNNNAVAWHPEYIRDGRMGNFLENVIDWAVSRERYWGTPLPIWICDDCEYTHCVGSIKELKEMAVELPERLELHRPYIDKARLLCPKCGGSMTRTKEVIDAWFDSGSMPFAQWHYPMENVDTFKCSFPADFISEAIDQTRGWFYTLLVISTLLFDEPPYKNVLVLGHVLDEQGLKMSKSKGNVVDTWEVFNTYGADAFRWYLYTVNPPWNPTRFYLEAIKESQRKFLSTLWNVYCFYVLYANVDKFDPRAYELPVEERSVLDKWIISRFNSVVDMVQTELEAYSITPAARAIEEFVDDLSNWYVRRSRRRYWGKGMPQDKVAAYLTLHEILVGLSKLLAPFTPFISEEIYRNLVGERVEGAPESVHLCDYPVCNEELIDSDLERSMAVARKLVTLGRAARNKVNIKIRQPLSEMLIVLSDSADELAVRTLAPIIKDELNIKSVSIAQDAGELMDYRIKPRFDLLGPKYGKLMKDIQAGLGSLDQREVVSKLESEGSVKVPCGGETVTIYKEELVIETFEREGFAIESEGGITCALRTALSPELIMEGLAREMVNKVQTMRKEADFNVEDRIVTRFWSDSDVEEASTLHKDYIMEETLSKDLIYAGKIDEAKPWGEYSREWDLNGHLTVIGISRKEED
ncbi:MAG: isoleucine--tRNA ligase [Bacillota bacterium]|jgi:isoleucyl-tRNA synthetase|nr:isoleucine--tRNA ligase [Bacillota bacterium]NLD11872.1 isoleucine--tRNA ligase [Bacillota bacterium]HOB88228.1 isoleucine--tRNA ligase [Bacillota bacterium]HPZ92365.1 isoleucine--tRNA ligase [Bacillota bacterium]HQE03608.1 isoleucine--tRNA ligase [Bacillota bacterium]